MPKRLVFLICFFPILLLAGGGDTLETYFKTIPHDSLGVRKLIDVSDKLSYSNEDAALRVAEEGLNIARELKLPNIIAEAMFNVGVRYMTESDYVRASQYLFPALNISDSLNDDAGRLRGLNSIGNLYARQNQFEEAARYYEKALLISRKLKNRIREGVILGNLGNIFYMQSEGRTDYLKKSESYYLQALDIAKKENQPFRALSAINNLTLVYADLNDPQKALQLCDTAMAFSVANNDSADMVYTYANYGRIYRDLKDYKKALGYLMLQRDLSKYLNNRDLTADAYRNLALCYTDLGDFEKAYQYEVLHSNLKDSIINTENTGIINDLKNKVENQRKESQISQLKQTNEIAELRNGRQKLFLAVSAIGLFLLGAFAFLLFNRARVKEKANKTLEKQNLIIAEKNKDITDSINYAKRIQESLFASESIMKSFLPEFFIFFKPRDIVSGDFWWITKKEDKIFLCVADCTGHGVPGAFMSLLGISFLNEAVVEKGIYNPNEIFDHVRSRIISSLSSEDSLNKNSDGMDGVLCCIDITSRKITFACANNPVWIDRGGKLIEFRPDKMPVGKHHGATTPFSIQEVFLGKDDIVYLFSDGFPDQFGGEHGKKFKYKPLQELLLNLSDKSMNGKKEKLEKVFMEWKGNLEQVDDVLLIGFKI